MFLKDFWQTLLEILYPRRCVFCKALLSESDKNRFCEQCLELVPDIRFVNPHILRPGYLDGLIFCTHYKHVKRVLQQAKFAGQRNQALILGEFLALAWQKPQNEFFAQLYVNDLKQFSAVSVPTDYKRMLARGYEIPKLLFAQWLKANNINYENVLRRVKNTAPQYQLNRKQRQENVFGSIQQIRSLAKDKILLLDDIFTTGASLNESARILKLNGAQVVIGITFASDNN